MTEQEITDRSADKLQQGYDGPSPRRLTVLYQSALLAVAALSLIGQALVQWQLIRQQSDAHVVNLAGRERMLSQRISKEALAWQTAANSTERGKRLQNLQESLQQWERNYLMLKNNEGYLADSTPNSRAVKSLFLQADQPFNFLRDAAHQLIEHSLAMPANTDESLADADLIKRRILQHEPEFLRLMDAIVDQYEIEATARVNTLRGFELLLLFLTLSVLAAEGLWIFRPAIGKLRASLAAVDRTQTKLQAARDAAERANQAKTIFLAGVSHELRSPLHILLGAATELAECSSPEQRKNLYDRIYTSVSGLDHLLANLLDAAQIEAGRLLTVAPVFTDVRHLTEEVTQLYEFESVRKGLDLKYIFAPIDACWTMPVDPLRFKQILMNLIGNALKYTENGGHILVKLQRTESHVLIEVKDSGIGIPPEDHARIFRCFERAAPKSLGSSGTGLGLYLTSQFVQAMGGNVSVRSKPGEGSIFSVTLPITQAVALGSSKVSSITGNYVMAVDDSLEALRIVEFYLRDLPLTVITCQHSELALSQFMNHDIGLVILDIDLPRLDGISLAKAIRDFERSHGRKACVMISLSAAMDQATIARCQSAGINDCLPKPITQAQLAAVVSRYMGQEDTASGTLMSDQFPAPLARLLICRAHELREQLRKAYHARDLSTFLRLAHQCINTFGYFTDATEVVGACKSLCGTEHFGTEVDEVMDCVEAWCDRHSKSDA